MERPLLMLSLPNSASTWIASVIARHLPGCRYYDKEFFNPVCNLKHEVALRRHFGSELMSCYANIATSGMERDTTQRPSIHDTIRETWGSEDYTFTKECQSAFKLPVLVEHFRVFCYLRPIREMFPPSRARVWSFFEHAWWALMARGDVELSAVTTMDRAQEAAAILQHQIITDAKALGVPVIWHGSMWDDRSSLEAIFTEAIGSAPEELLREIINSRRTKQQIFDAMGPRSLQQAF